MLILFCSDPLNPKEVDIDYFEEFKAATGCGLFDAALIDFEVL